MEQTEVRIIDIDKVKAREALGELGAVCLLNPTIVREVYLEHPAVSAESRSYSDFRLRSVGDHVELSVKVKREDPKFSHREEHKISLSSFEDAVGLLDALGYRVSRRREKICEEYQLDGVKVEIDEYPGMKPYIQIEGCNVADIKSLVEALGCAAGQAVCGTSSEVIASAGLDPDMVAFTPPNPILTTTKPPSNPA